MFIEEKFILAHELVQHIGVGIGNISMLRKEYVSSGDYYTILKLGSCIYVNSESKKLPQQYRDAIRDNEFTSMRNKLPVSHVKLNINATQGLLTKGGMIDGIITISGKRFYVFKDEIVSRIGSHIPYILNYDETMNCKKNNQIIDYIKLTSNRYFVWY